MALAFGKNGGIDCVYDPNTGTLVERKPGQTGSQEDPSDNVWSYIGLQMTDNGAFFYDIEKAGCFIDFNKTSIDGIWNNERKVDITE